MECIGIDFDTLKWIFLLAACVGGAIGYEMGKKGG